tara:strand:+ start:4709 stop:5611 length:903 start_codon:yes stop_codon:yes gene_type:complete
MHFENKNILVTGGKGMIGRSLIKILEEYKTANITIADLPEFDLRERKICQSLCEGQHIIFHLAGIKGSPLRCLESPASFSVPMIQFNANMIEAAFNAGAEWFLYTSSIGVYQPANEFFEDSVWTTMPSENDWFAGWAKRIGEMNLLAYAKQFNWYKYSIARPANVYGPYDNFGEYSMVIPSLIKKGIENDVLEVWGDGKPIRDLIYVDDIAHSMIKMVENEVTDPINLGSGEGVSIKHIAEIVAEYFNIDIKWDISKPSGDMKRIMNTKRAQSYGILPQVGLKEGIIKTIDWYMNNKNVL